MDDELLDRVRSLDPLPSGSAAPPFGDVYARMASASVPASTVASAVRRRGRSGRLIGLMVPVGTAAVSLGVIAVVVAVMLGGAPSRRHRESALSPVPTAPSTGMSGFVALWGAGFTTGGAGVISVEQCRGCGAGGGATGHSSFQDWLIATRDGGRSWAQGPEDYYLSRIVFDGRSGSAAGMQEFTKRESIQDHSPARWEPGATTPLTFTSRNGGRRWNAVVTNPAPDVGDFLSVRDGEVWAMGPGSIVLRAPVASGRFTATAAAPQLGRDGSAEVVGAGADEAYVVNPGELTQSFVTRDGGRSWSPITAPSCKGVFTELDAAVGRTVWVTCVTARHSVRLLRSTDGGLDWQSFSADWLGNVPTQFTAVSSRDLWAMRVDGAVMRSVDGGRTWAVVWSLADERAHPLSGPISPSRIGGAPILSVQSAQSASVVTLLNRRRASRLTDLVTYRTTDGGRTWRTFVVKLAH